MEKHTHTYILTKSSSISPVTKEDSKNSVIIRKKIVKQYPSDILVSSLLISAFSSTKTSIKSLSSYCFGPHKCILSLYILWLLHILPRVTSLEQLGVAEFIGE